MILLDDKVVLQSFFFFQCPSYVTKNTRVFFLLSFLINVVTSCAGQGCGAGVVLEAEGVEGSLRGSLHAYSHLKGGGAIPKLAVEVLY